MLDSSVSPPPARQLVWRGLERASSVDAAFEVHEAAMTHGLMPEEAVTLSMVVARIGAVASAPSEALATVSISSDGWRVEIERTGSVASTSEALSIELLNGQSTMRVEQRGGVRVLVVEYRRTH